tara:strand:+ start:295 stop:510 length:216 start_codon:yes stop_codon:yes gene_type:complete
MNEINSESVIQLDNILEEQSTKTQKGFLSKVSSLMETNPNYKMLGALGMMLLNFSVCVTVANWLKNSTLVS